MPILNPTEYVRPCRTNGRCHDIRMKHLFPHRPEPLKSEGPPGFSYVAFGTKKECDEPENQVKFKCCQSCHQPITATEAFRLNGEIGFELPSVKDTLSRLKAMKERLKQNEGRTR